MPQAKCRSCGKPIVWVRMLKSGKKNPMDIEPVQNGNVLVSQDPAGGPDEVGEVLTGERLSEKQVAGELLYLSHFASCANSKMHRRQ